METSIRARLGVLKKKIVRAIPVYGHYREEEDLREWDRSIRDECISSLQRTEKQIESMLPLWVAKRDKNKIAVVESLRGNIRSRRETIRTSAYGFWPRLSPIKIDGTVLRAVLDVDESILSASDRLLDQVTQEVARMRTISDGDQQTKALSDLEVMLTSHINSIETLALRRLGMLRTGKVEAT